MHSSASGLVAGTAAAGSFFADFEDGSNGITGRVATWPPVVVECCRLAIGCRLASRRMGSMLSRDATWESDRCPGKPTDPLL
jgi:hypothetical protein